MTSEKYLADLHDMLKHDKIPPEVFRRHMVIFMIDVLERLMLIESLRSNPLVALGAVAQKHPKICAVLFFWFTLLLNVWFIDGLRRIALTVVGAPPEVIDLLAPLSPTPIVP